MVMTLERNSISVDSVCDLIAAAGPLTAGDIAGGLDVTVGAAAHYVQSLVSAGSLREDEFGRYSLSGDCARSAF
jgi:predicted transcriptional regulator